jgi:hypothetical protein
MDDCLYYVYGVFQWNRVPMGVKPAASYFQRTMTQEVLPGLVYSCCEVYIDDVLVYGRDEDEYIGNLRLVFQRFREIVISYRGRKRSLI